MKWFFRSISVVFHPISMPLFGVLLFYRICPIFYSTEIKNATYISIAILTIIVPLLIAIILKKFRFLADYEISNARERILPLFINLLITATILLKLLPKIDAAELYYFFLGILGSTLACLIMAIFKVKASIHMTGISGLMMFIIGLGIHYAIDITLLLALLIIAAGFVASSRLYLKAHSNTELIIGIITGILPQLLTFQYWL
ncbi:hypothetical protein NBRC110019_00090 [Neptunitalea chrysea]|uniref:Transmembrane protein n=1 Tax=Neptunitalea chrysea TaxID=1647581 RepID=A0A9W6B3P5_9FLAO|nr:hypothetical protein [Neptunitalea chrysea]GLB50970.1 hypothetical protein NBRC110019_00090 [Neptunitalea chrysea]